MSGVFTDSHAHLEMVAERLGDSFLTELLAAYVARPGAYILDIGVDPGDLARRRAKVETCLPVVSHREKGTATHGAAPSAPFEVDAPPIRPFVENTELESPVRWAAGVWPGPEALAHPQLSLDSLERDLASGVDALGECGLDYHHLDGGAEAQKALFAAQIELALRHGLPLIVHSRDAFDDTLELVKPCASHIPVIIHCFSYGLEEAHAFLNAGCDLSFAGNITYGKKSQPLRDAVAFVPMERLLLETDAPYMNPMPNRGKPSCPLDIERTYQTVASLRNTDADALKTLVSSNFRCILGISL